MDEIAEDRAEIDRAFGGWRRQPCICGDDRYAHGDLRIGGTPFGGMGPCSRCPCQRFELKGSLDSGGRDV